MNNPHKNKILISRFDFENSLQILFGLKLDKDSVLKYTDTYIQNQSLYKYKHPKIFTCSFIDNTGHSWYNVNSEFYKVHTINKTELFIQFKHLINTYTFKLGNYFFF